MLNIAKPGSNSDKRCIGGSYGRVCKAILGFDLWYVVGNIYH